jgi:hypothetical protein
MNHLIALLRVTFRNVPGADEHIDWLEQHAHTAMLTPLDAVSDPPPNPPEGPGGD